METLKINKPRELEMTAHKWLKEISTLPDGKRSLIKNAGFLPTVENWMDRYALQMVADKDKRIEALEKAVFDLERELYNFKHPF